MTDDLGQAAGDGPEIDEIDGLALEAAEPAIAETATAPIVPVNAGDASLLGLIDRLGDLLERSDLTELEVEVGSTALVLRKPTALAPPLGSAAAIEASCRRRGPGVDAGRRHADGGDPRPVAARDRRAAHRHLVRVAGARLGAVRRGRPGGRCRPGRRV